MSTISKSQLGSIIMIFASVLIAAGATWAAFPDAGDAGWYVVFIGAGLGVTGQMMRRNAGQCSKERAEV